MHGRSQGSQLRPLCDGRRADLPALSPSIPVPPFRGHGNRVATWERRRDSKHGRVQVADGVRVAGTPCLGFPLLFPLPEQPKQVVYTHGSWPKLLLPKWGSSEREPSKRRFKGTVPRVGTILYEDRNMHGQGSVTKRGGPYQRMDSSNKDVPNQKGAHRTSKGPKTMAHRPIRSMMLLCALEVQVRQNRTLL